MTARVEDDGSPERDNAIQPAADNVCGFEMSVKAGEPNAVSAERWERRVDTWAAWLAALWQEQTRQRGGPQRTEGS